jgi:hypothetical protein
VISQAQSANERSKRFHTCNMNTLTSGLHAAGEGIGQGVGGVASIWHKAVTPSQGTDDKARDPPESDDTGKDPAATKKSEDASSPASGSVPTTAEHGGGLFHSVTTGITSGANFIFSPTAGALTSSTTLVRDATAEGFSIGQKVAKSGLDMGTNVVTGTASFTGTALGGVISTAAETSGAVFEPVGSGLKAVQGLDKLGHGVDAIKGLAVGAVSQVSLLTTKALNMSGKVQSFAFPKSLRLTL